MRAIVVKNTWIKSLDELVVDNAAPEPRLGMGKVLVAVKAVGANFFDTLMVQGKYQVKPPVPFIPGTEFAGDIIGVHLSIGEEYKLGDRVFGSCIGCYAERLSVTVESIHKIPEGMSYEEAAGLYITFPTRYHVKYRTEKKKFHLNVKQTGTERLNKKSYSGLVLRAKLRKDEWCLVHAGAGGVGLAATQIAKALGARVIATAGSPEKLDVAKKYGADHVIDYTDKSWPEKVMKITNQHGADVVFDPVGLIETSMKCTAWSGRLIVVGFTGGGGNIEKVAMNRVLLKNISITGVHWGAYSKFEPARIPEVWNAIFQLIRAGDVKPVVYKKIYHGLGQVPNALADIGSRKTWGKVIVTPNPEGVAPTDISQSSKI